MAKRRRKKRLRWDRVLIALMIVSMLGFGVYKGTNFLIQQVVSLFSEPKSEVSEPETKPQTYKATVILDPGHGGSDAGANDGTLYEKDITLKTSEYIKEELEKYRIKTILTRVSDTALEDEKDADLLARSAFSQRYNADYFISIHVNGYDKSNSVYGFEVYTRNKESASLANMILTQMDTLNYSKNRGLVDGSTLRVLKTNTVPAVLVELGYIKSQDKDYLSDDYALQKIAKAIAKGIDNKVEE